MRLRRMEEASEEEKVEEEEVEEEEDDEETEEAAVEGGRMREEAGGGGGGGGGEAPGYMPTSSRPVFLRALIARVQHVLQAHWPHVGSIGCKLPAYNPIGRRPVFHSGAKRLDTCPPKCPCTTTTGSHLFEIIMIDDEMTSDKSVLPGEKSVHGEDFVSDYSKGFVSLLLNS